MSTVAGRFPYHHVGDRNFHLIMLIMIWAAIGWGFGTEIYDHISAEGPAFPLIVHIHAVVFTGFLALFTVQILLVRASRTDLHRRLGVLTASMIPMMVVLGPVTALHVQYQDIGLPNADPAFLITQMSDLVAFGLLGGAAVYLRWDPAAHKRLMLLATIYITDAGFARILYWPLYGIYGDGVLSNWIETYMAPFVLMLVAAGYDLLTRNRIHPAYYYGLTLTLLIQFGSSYLYYQPWWIAAAKRMIGY